MHPSGPSHAQFKGVGEIGGDFWLALLRGANGGKRRRILDFNLTKRYLWTLFRRQNRVCAYTGLALILHPRSERTASVDRIDSTKGYIKGNVQWVHKDINMMKGSLSHERFMELCCLVKGQRGKHERCPSAITAPPSSTPPPRVS